MAAGEWFSSPRHQLWLTFNTTPGRVSHHQVIVAVHANAPTATAAIQVVSLSHATRASARRPSRRRLDRALHEPGCYTGQMRSVADSLRDETRRQTSTLTPEARIARAHALGDADVQALCEARGLTPAEAKATIARTRRLGRRPSRTHGD